MKHPIIQLIDQIAGANASVSEEVLKLRRLTAEIISKCDEVNFLIKEFDEEYGTYWTEEQAAELLSELRVSAMANQRVIEDFIKEMEA